MNFDQVVIIYREVVDSTATVAEGVSWWRDVKVEIVALIAAPTKAAAAAVIAWWKSEYE